jgi:DnaK suppressor protein
MYASNLKKYKSVLETKRIEILKLPDRSTAVEDNMRTGDWVDHSSQENDLHVNLALKQTDTKLLRAIEEALARVENGTYGICMDCDEPIAEVRLDAVPWTRVCIDCKQGQDNRKK